MENKIPLLVIAGPTASGKTACAVELAKIYDGEIVSADSMQIYKGLSIATAKPTKEEMQGVPHYLVDFLEPEQAFSVADYVKLAGERIREIHSRGKVPILCGGTGLYISSLVNNVIFDDTETVQSENVLRRKPRRWAVTLCGKGSERSIPKLRRKSMRTTCQGSYEDLKSLKLQVYRFHSIR